MKNSLSFELTFTYEQCAFFSLVVFKMFYLSLFFRILTMMCFTVDFLGFILFGVFSVSGICKFMAFAKFGMSLVLWVLFQSYSLSLLVCEWHECWISCYCPTGPWDYSVCIRLFFYLRSDWVNFIYLSSRSLILSSVISTIEPIQWIFIFVIFSQVCNSFGSVL